MRTTPPVEQRKASPFAAIPDEEFKRAEGRVMVVHMRPPGGIVEVLDTVEQALQKYANQHEWPPPYAVHSIPCFRFTSPTDIAGGFGQPELVTSEHTTAYAALDAWLQSQLPCMLIVVNDQQQPVACGRTFRELRDNICQADPALYPTPTTPVFTVTGQEDCLYRNTGVLVQDFI